MRLSPILPLALLAVAAFAQAEPASPLGAPSGRTGLLLTDHAVIQLIQNSSGDLAHQSVSQLSMWQRVVASEQYEKAVEWIARRAAEFGMEDAHVERFPSDGKIHYFEYKSERFWNVRGGELWLTSPFTAKLTSYAELPISLCRDSTSANAEAEIADIGDGLSDAGYTKPVKGKIVLTSSDPEQIVERAVYKEGALGIISDWNIPEWDRLNRLPGDSPDLVGWRYLPDPGDKHGTFAFMISPRRGQELRHMMRSGQTLRARATVNAEMQSGSLSVVTAVIRGSKYPDEEILVTSHLDEIGADDNASGSASILEMGRTLAQLVARGELPRPLRTIRFLWVPEFAGSYAWLSKHHTEPARRIADLNYDEMGANLLTMNAVLNVSYTPDSVPSYLNAVMESVFGFLNRYNDVSYPLEKDFHVISVNGTRNRLNARMLPFIGGSDSIVYNHLGIPGTFVTAWPETYYHSSQDTPDKVDATQLHRGVVSGLAALVTLAYADDADARNLALLTFAFAQRRAGEGQAQAAARIMHAAASTVVESAYAADRMVHHAYGREAAAIRSCSRFARTAATREAVEQIASTLGRGEQPARQQTEEFARRRAEALGVSFTKYQLSAAEQRCANLVPARKPGQELMATQFVFEKLKADPAAKIPVIQQGLEQTEKIMRSHAETDLRLMGFADAPAYYADGNRSILEIRDEVLAEYAPIPVEILELYFRAFEKAGVMSVAEK